jgi:hypothetical protein
MENSLLTAKHVVLNLGKIVFQFKRLSFRIPQNFELIVSAMSLFAYSIVNRAYN